MIIFVGIDPGKDGAIGWVDGTLEHVGAIATPLKLDEGKQGKTTYDIRRMREVIGDVTRGFEPVVTMELVSGYRGQGGAASFEFGRGFGLWQASLDVYQIAPRLVPPVTWKRTMLAGIANDKETEAKILAQRLHDHSVCRTWRGPKGKLLDGKVDAIWLALYGRAVHRFG